MNLSITTKIFLSLPFFAAVAADYPPQPDAELHPGGSLWKKAARFTVPAEGIVLGSDAEITVDELTINGRILTNGHRLQIDAKRVTFGEKGSIVAFDGPVPGAPATADTGLPGMPGGDANEQGKKKPGGNGAEGKTGKRGTDGAPGDQNPSEILIFAAEVIGVPVIDGTGQKGQKGGKGGQGGRGGDGGKGGKAWIGCFAFIPVGETNAGNGGNAGRGGQGGRGGDGGKGGKAVKVRFLLGQNHPNVDVSKVISREGKGGQPGDAGDPGLNGNPGPGGDGDAANCWFYSREIGGGGKGAEASGNAGTQGPGDVGPSGDHVIANRPNADSVLHVFNELEALRSNVFQAWYGFHWARTLEFLVRDTVRLLADTDWTREQIRSIDAESGQLLLEANALFAATLQNAWEQHFLAPIKALPVDEQRKLNVQYALDVAQAMVKVLETVSNGAATRETSQDLSLILEVVDSEFQTRLHRAIETCKLFNKEAVKSIRAGLPTDDSEEASTYLKKSLWGATAHYEIPVCNGSAKFLEKGHLYDPILVQRKNAARVIPDDFQSMLQIASSKKQPSSLMTAALGLLVPDACAADEEPEPAPDFQVVLVNGNPISVQLTKESIPVAHPTVSRSGVFEGYVVPAEKDVDRTTINYFLRVESLLTGARQ